MLFGSWRKKLISSCIVLAVCAGEMGAFPVSAGYEAPAGKTYDALAYSIPLPDAAEEAVDVPVNDESIDNEENAAEEAFANEAQKPVVGASEAIDPLPVLKAPASSAGIAGGAQKATVIEKSKGGAADTAAITPISDADPVSFEEKAPENNEEQNEIEIVSSDVAALSGSEKPDSPSDVTLSDEERDIQNDTELAPEADGSENDVPSVSESEPDAEPDTQSVPESEPDTEPDTTSISESEPDAGFDEPPLTESEPDAQPDPQPVSAEEPDQKNDPPAAPEEKTPSVNQQTSSSANADIPKTAAAEEGQKAPEKTEEGNKKEDEKIALRGADDSVILYVTQPNSAGTEIKIEKDTEKQLSFTIPEEGFSPGSFVVSVDTVSGQDFGFSFTVTDSNSEQIALAWCDNYANEYYDQETDTYQTGSRIDSWDIFFTLSEPGTYTVNISNVYFNNYDEEIENTEATVSAKVYKTIDPPVFGVTEEGFSEAFDLTFADVPEDCDIYYSIFTREQHHGYDTEYSLYDPASPPRISEVCRITAYYLKETPLGAFKSDSAEIMYYPDFENAVSNIQYPDNVIASGDTITLSIQDTSLKIYYIMAKDGIDWENRNTRYILENGSVYTGPIVVTGDKDDYYELLYMAVTPGGACSEYNEEYFTIGTPPPPIPTFSPDDENNNGSYTPIVWDSPRTVTITSVPGTTICYMMNSSLSSFDKNTSGAMMTETNTLTVTADRDMKISVRAYDAENDVYSSVRAYGYGSGNSERAYVIGQPKALTVSRSGEVSSDGTIILGYNEEYTLDVQDRGAYKITVERPDIYYYYSNLPVYLFDRDQNTIAALEDYDSVRSRTVTIEKTLDIGTYSLLLAYDKGNNPNNQGYTLTIAKGMEAPQFSVEGGTYGEPFELYLTHPDPNCVIYYKFGYYGDEMQYTGPITVDRSTYIYAYASADGAVSDTVEVYYDVDADPPVLDSYYRFYERNKGYIYSSTVLNDTAYIQVRNIYDYGSGIDHTDIYMSVEGGAYNKIGTYYPNEDFVWDTRTVPGSERGAVNVRLLPIAYDRTGHASAAVSELNDEYDVSYSPAFKVNNAPCAPVDTVSYETGVSSITLRWEREEALTYNDRILIYRSQNREDLADNLLKEESYYSYNSTDYFYTKQSASASYYYGITVKDSRGIESEMKVIGPVSPIEDTTAPTLNISGVEDNGYINTASINIYPYDETAVIRVLATITAADGTEIPLEGSPWEYEPYHGAYYNCLISEEEIAGLSDGAYTLIVSASDCFGTVSEKTIHFVKDTAAPEAPVLTVSAIPGKIDLRWTAPADPDVIGYNVFYSESEEGPFYKANGEPLTERSFTFPQYYYDFLAPGTEYWFYVCAVDKAQNTGESLHIKGTAGKYNPQIRLTNENPRLGESIEIAFSGFRQSEYIDFYLDRSEEAFTSAWGDDPAAEGTVTLNGDLTLRGVHTIKAVGSSSGAVAQIRFTVADLSPSVRITPSAVSARDRINIMLDNFPADIPVYFYTDPLEDSTSDAPYSYFRLSDDYSGENYYLSSFGELMPGEYILRAVEPESGLTAFTTLTVISPEVSLSCEKELPKAGEYVRFYAYGFDTGYADLYINGEKVGNDYRSGIETEHSFGVTIPQSLSEAGVIMVTAVHTESGKEVSKSVALGKDTAGITISKESVGFETFTITGTGFRSYEPVKLYIDGNYISSATNYYGTVSFDHSFDYAAEPGRHGIVLYGENSGSAASGSVIFTDTVQTLILSGQPVLNQPLTMYAAGFRSGEKISFSINDVITGNKNADQNGSAAFTVDTLEYSPANGSYAFTATGSTSGRIAFYGVSAQSGGDLELSYEGNIRSGSTVNITVTGLDAGEGVDIYQNNKTIEAVYADEAGRAVKEIRIPGGYTGNIPLTARGKTSQKWGTVLIPVSGYDPSLSLTPSLPGGGDTVLAAISGHMPSAVLKLRFDGHDTGREAVVSQSGEASFEYILPLNTAPGEHTISVYDAVSGAVLSKALNVSLPSVSFICPETAAPGETVTLGAAGLAEGETLRISVNGQTIGEFSENEGRAQTAYNIPGNLPAGNYKVLFALEKAAMTETINIMLLSSAASVRADMNEGNASITIEAENFMAYEPLSVYFDNRLINDSLEKYTTGADGSLRAVYSLPVTTLAGEHSVGVFGRNSHKRASDVVTVSETGPIISLANGATEGKAGDTLEYQGVNFTASGLYDLYFESELLLSGAEADENGEIAGSFVIPNGFADGRYQLIANDIAGGRIAVCYIRIDTTPPAAPSLTLFARKQSINLSWDAPPDEDIIYYSVYCRPEDETAYIKLADVESRQTTWTHDMHNSTCPISVGKRYEYTVTATDRMKNESEGSKAMSALLAGGADAPVVSYAYADTGSYVRINNEYLATVKGSEAAFYVYAADDQEITSFTIAIAPENGEFTVIGSPEPVFNGNSGSNAEYRAALNIDTTAFADGAYIFRFTATDSSDNSAFLERRYYLDNTAPAPVSGLNASGGANSIAVTWSWTPGPTGEVPDRYIIYYSKDSDFETYSYNYVYESEGTKAITIRRLDPDEVYYVRITTADAAGNESEYIEKTASPFADNEKPVIKGISPESGRLGKNVDFWIDAEDNAEIDHNSVRAQINAGNNGTFIPFGECSYGAVRANDLTYNGAYTLRFYVSDLSENESDAYEITREFDTYVTPVTGLSASPAAGGIRLTWDKSSDNDLSYYYVYRSEGGEFELKNYLSPLKITMGNTVSWTDYQTADGINYTYKIVAVDDIFNRSSLDDTTGASSYKGSYNTSMTASPAADVKPGSIIHISASGFRGGEYVTAYIDDIESYILWTYADDEGNVSTDWSYVKATGAGSHTIKLVGGYSLAEASAGFICKPDHLPAPEGLEAVPGVMEIGLSWEGVENASYYRVYRNDGTAEELIADRVYTRSYRDTTVKMTADEGNIYTYTVAAVDRYGSEGSRSEPTVNRPDPDLTDPQTDVFTFQRNLNNIIMVAEVSDDLCLGSVIFKYKPANAPDSEYTLIDEITVGANRKTATVSASFDTSSLGDGKYTLMVQTKDAAGRASVPVTKILTITSQAPNAPEELTAEAGQMRINLSWREPSGQEVRIAHYNIYRRSGDQGYEFIASTTLTSYTDPAVDNNISYLYQVTGVSESETEGPAATLSERVSPGADTVSPEITGFTIPQGTRVAGVISLAVSVTDNVGVERVDFFIKTGEEYAKIGSSAAGAISVDTAEYVKEGTLEFKAAAYDAAGNSCEAAIGYQVDNAPPGAPVLSVSESELYLNF